jgi:mannose-6-phosphate isomerase-like protein (cupin superfamily)
MQVIQLSDIDFAGYYREFLRVPAMSLGLYKHPAGADVPQKPHLEDEIYHVVAGRGKIEISGLDYDVKPGSVVYVPAHAAHRFHSVTEALEVLVVFAPAETPRS